MERVGRTGRVAPLQPAGAAVAAGSRRRRLGTRRERARRDRRREVSSARYEPRGGLGQRPLPRAPLAAERRVRCVRGCRQRHRADRRRLELQAGPVDSDRLERLLAKRWTATRLWMSWNDGSLDTFYTRARSASARIPQFRRRRRDGHRARWKNARLCRQSMRIRTWTEIDVG